MTDNQKEAFEELWLKSKKDLHQLGKVIEIYGNNIINKEQAYELFGLGYQAALAHSQQWISVEDRLPEEGDAVIGYGFIEAEINGRTKEMHVGSGIWQGNYIDLPSDAYYCWLVDVIHWMPLPQPLITNRKD